MSKTSFISVLLILIICIDRYNLQKINLDSEDSNPLLI